MLHDVRIYVWANRQHQNLINVHLQSNISSEIKQKKWGSLLKWRMLGMNDGWGIPCTGGLSRVVRRWMASEGHLACESPSTGTSTKRGVCDIYIFLTSREVNLAEYWTLKFDILQDFCYCCCCEKETRRKSSNLDLTISCLHLKIYKQYELRRYLICQLPVLRTYALSIRQETKISRVQEFQRFWCFRPRHRGRKGTKTARVEWEHWNAPQGKKKLPIKIKGNYSS